MYTNSKLFEQLFFLILARQIPFKITFKTDEDEITNSGTPTSDFKVNELSGTPTGTFGFLLNYEQKAC